MDFATPIKGTGGPIVSSTPMMDPLLAANQSWKAGKTLGVFHRPTYLRLNLIKPLCSLCNINNIGLNTINLFVLTTYTVVRLIYFKPNPT